MGVILKPRVLVVEPPRMARTSCFSLLFANHPSNHMKLFPSPKRVFFKKQHIISRQNPCCIFFQGLLPFDVLPDPRLGVFFFSNMR